MIFAFLPNVWLYGGTGLSDEPSVVVLLFAIAFLLRPKWYFLGCVLLGIALTFRPQSALMAIYPWLAASWPRFRARRSDPLLGALVIIVICAIAYGIAAYLTGWDQYRMAVRLHGEYIASVDSFRNPARPPVLEVARRYAIDPFFARRRAIVLAFFAIVGLLRFRRGTREAILIFGPFFVFACFMFDFIALSRYSIAYMPLTAILAADGIAVASFRRSVLQAAFAVAAIAPLVPMTWRAMREVRAHDSPPAAAAQWIRSHVDRRTATIYVHDSVSPHAEYFLNDYRHVPVDDTFSPAIVTTSRNAWLFREGATSAAGAVNFHRQHGDLWDIVRTPLLRRLRPPARRGHRVRRRLVSGGERGPDDVAVDGRAVAHARSGARRRRRADDALLLPARCRTAPDGATPLQRRARRSVRGDARRRRLEARAALACIRHERAGHRGQRNDQPRAATPRRRHRATSACASVD